jgi:hypothetical protein
MLAGAQLVVACSSSQDCPAYLRPGPRSDITLSSACGIASATTNCAAKRTLTANSVTFSPVVTETCKAKLVLANGEVENGTLSFERNSAACDPPWTSTWNGRPSLTGFAVGQCQADAGSDAALGGA